MDAFLQAAALVFTPTSLIYMFLGVFFGILCGAMPGLSAVMAVSILLPFTFSLDQAGIMMLLGTFCGAIYGGSITAILINTPGTANSAATCLDGYPMATKLGQPGRALSISTMASTFGGLFSACALLFTAPLLSKIALNFGVPEMFALGVFGLSIVTAVPNRRCPVRGAADRPVRLLPVPCYSGGIYEGVQTGKAQEAGPDFAL